MKEITMDHIEITEEDIFSYVYSKESLSKDKIDYLDANRELFKNEIDLFMTIKNSPLTEEIKSSKNIILQKINSSNIIVLFPQITGPIEENGVKLVAASILKEKKSNSMSFTDSKSKYFIRIVKTESKTLLYLFPEDKTKTHFTIHFSPSGSEYKIDNISEPIEIIEEDLIESITLS